MATHLIEQLLLDEKASLGLPVEYKKEEVEAIKDLLEIHCDIIINDDTRINEELVNAVTEEIQEWFNAKN